MVVVAQLVERRSVAAEVVGAEPIYHPTKNLNNMSVKITYFVHGTTTDNEIEISSGWKDVELSQLGIEQSIALKDKTKDKHFDVVFCSDLQRAVKSVIIHIAPFLLKVLGDLDLKLVLVHILVNLES